MVHRLQGLEEHDQGAILEVFEWRPLPSGSYNVGPFEMQSWSLPHFVPNAGVRLAADGLVVAYTGDTGPDPCLPELARGADLFIAEASDRRQRPDTPSATEGQRMHLSAHDAGAAAQAADAKALLLTHFWPGNDREASRNEAAAAYDGKVLLADEGMQIDLPP